MKVEVKRCFKARAGLNGNAYHPILIANCITTKSGDLVRAQVNETCPTCYPEEAFAEQEQRRQREEKRVAREKKLAEEDAERSAAATPDLSECLDPFSYLLS